MKNRELEHLSRRQLLQAAGGVTLLALVPRFGSATESPTYELPVGGSGMDRPPIFTAVPYLQPGPDSSKLVEGQESLIIAWQTDDTPANFQVTYGASQLAEIQSVKKFGDIKKEGENRINYAAKITGLKLGTKYKYRVAMNGETVLEGYFTTRKPRGAKTRFVSFGDNSYGDVSDRAVAFQAYKAMPDFVMNAGDNVYESGRDDEYARYFFPVYNADQAGPRIGAPLLRSVPFYTVIANHDVPTKGPGGPVADFTKNPDSLGIFTNMYLPLNGPVASHPTPAVGAQEHVDSFKKAAGDRFPKQANYSFDYGDAHFLCLDSNTYVDPTDAALQAWIEQDLAGTDAEWKIVVYHHPAYNVGAEHYAEQQMRVLSPLFERHGVSLVLSGHEHNYQRTKPLKFAPKDESGAKDIGKGHRLVPGDFTVDSEYNGVSKSKPGGIIYLTTGAGGKHLYDPDFNHNPKNWTHEEDSNVAYVETMISDRHSITVVDVSSKALDCRQVDEWGNEVDRFRIEKA
jgi:hypothetical protein